LVFIESDDLIFVVNFRPLSVDVAGRSQLRGGSDVDVGDGSDETRRQAEREETRRRLMKPVEKKQKLVCCVFLSVALTSSVA